MRIGIFSECYRPMLNGVVISVETFRAELERLGHEVFVLTTAYRNYHETDPHVQRFKSVQIPHFLDYPIAVPYAPWSLGRVRRLGLEIVHSQSPFAMGQMAAFFARRNRLPLVFTYHTMITEYVHYVPFFRSVTKAAARAISRSYANAADRVVTPTGAVRDLLRGYGVRSPIEVIPTGVDAAQVRAASPPEWMEPIADGKRILLYVGRLAVEKSVDFVLFAFAQIHARHPDTHLLLVGGGPWETYLRRLARRLGVAEHVTFTGLVPKEEALGAYHKAEVFVFPSTTETQGLVLVEAMAAGVPCVAVEAAASADVIQNGVSGYLVPKEETAMAGRVCEVLESPELRRRLSAGARRRALDFSPAGSARKLVRVYEECLAGRS
jgi:1,2-diacylglycerol 3-alpha-glucosyltransferase